MLAIFLLQIVITIICSLAGILFYLFMPKKREFGARPLIFYPIMGLIAISLISQVAVLFFPVNLFFSLSSLLLIFILVFIKRKRVIPICLDIVRYLKGQSIIQMALAVSVWLMIIVLNSGPTVMDDTESYHIQMVKWANEYGTVPGIVNLHFRFGFNSSWFTAISFFLPPVESLNFFTVLNGTISAWFGMFLLLQLTPLVQRGRNNSISPIQIGILFALLLSFFCWPMIRATASTANYDFITTVLVLVLFIKLLQEGKQITPSHFAPELIIWPVYLFTVRIINYPLLFLSVYGLYLLLKEKDWRRAGLFLFVAAALVGPFLTRNLILSGYPFYPSTAFNFFNLDWKADNEMINWLKHYIKYYNRVNEGLLSIEETAQLKSPNWILSWFRYMYLYDKPVVIAGMAGLLLNFIFLKRALVIYSTPIRIFILVICAQLISWFLVAPDPRFVYGCLLCGAILLPVIILKNRSGAINRSIFQCVFIGLASAVLFYTAMKIGQNKAYRNFLLPYRLPQPPVKEVVVDKIPLKIPDRIRDNWNARCYSTDLPCLYIVNPKLRARGKTIGDGFRLEK